MSYQRALQTLHLQPTDRVAHQETLDHPAFMRELIGFDPWDDPLQAYVQAYRALDVDWIIGMPRSAVRFAPGETSRAEGDDIRYTEWGLSGSSWREHRGFADIESVLAYDPVVDLAGTSGESGLAATRADQALLQRDTLVSGIYYTTLFQFPIMTFGWELFLTAAGCEPERFQRVLRGFADVSRRHLTDIAAGGQDLILLHDDIAMERGPVFRPDWYRQRLFPLYEYLLEPLRSCGQTKVAFVSDGDYTPLLADLVALGFDGFIINANMDLGAIARRYGADHFLVGNVSTNVLTFGTPEDVTCEVRRCLEEARPCAGHFIKATGDLPHNIPLDNIRTYFAAAADLGQRR